MPRIQQIGDDLFDLVDVGGFDVVVSPKDHSIIAEGDELEVDESYVLNSRSLKNQVVNCVARDERDGVVRSHLNLVEW